MTEVEALALFEFVLLLEASDSPELHEVLSRPDARLVKAMLRFGR